MINNFINSSYVKIKQTLSKLTFFLAKIPNDKLLHFSAGAVVFAIFNLFFGKILAVSVVCAIAAAKEACDSAHKDKHTADWWDFIVTVGGGLIGLMCTWRVHV